MEDNLIQQSQPEKRTISFSFISLIILILLLAGAGCVFWFWYINAQMHKPLLQEASSPVIFTVAKGDSASAIAQNLMEKRIIDSEFIFRMYVWEKGLHRLQAGRYAVSAHMTPAEIADMMESGKAYYDYVKVTIPEGFTIADIQKRITEMDFLEKSEKRISDFTVADFIKQYNFLADAPAHAKLEGYLFPDTYQFERGVSSGFVVQKMLDDFGQKFTQALRQETVKQGKSIYDIITMASIIEREVRTQDDMKMVSGILWKRIAIGMPLQADATVGYAVGKQELSLDDLRTDSPYNTYRYKGLPEGPIANPGLRAIQAALEPADSDYLFYLSKPDGTTVFSRTLQEHNKAKATYLK